ncbi:TIR domain-containing protein [Rhizobium leguminosarum]|uniref:TIR domain-containing protein n=1 Tax=Rhizobium leguminosarum TaxID=384 RepID=UPI001C985783|nr:TIR domain-containing protein [Rhizobium leguminosarum]MBY5672296.1 TIR domain-containing protein [Rhizobium leguminosarum]MBY5684994.1 TIR domain-containing protein [Rhizobium leguminosarum]
MSNPILRGTKQAGWSQGPVVSALRWIRSLAYWVDALWGYDVFIAHRRSDGEQYAKALYGLLQKKGIGCFLDQRVYVSGDSLPHSTKRNVSKSTILVLISSAQLYARQASTVYDRDWVLEELNAYLESRNENPKVLVIDFDGELQRSIENPIAQKLQHYLRVTQPDEALQRVPSSGIITTIEKQLGNERRDKSRLRVFQAIAVSLLVLALASMAGLLWATHERAIAQEQGRLALSQLLAKKALDERSGRLDRAELLSLAGVRINDNAITERALLDVLQYPSRRFTSVWADLGAVNDLVFSPDGKFLVAAGSEGDLARWSLSDLAGHGETMQGHTAEVKSAAFVSDLELIASAGADNRVLVWDLTQQPANPKVLNISEPNLWRAVPLDAHRVATVHYGKSLSIVSIDTGESIASQTVHDVNDGPYYALAYSPGIGLLASGSGAGVIRLWSSEDLAPSGEPMNAGAYVHALAFSPSDSILSVGTASGEIQLWDTAARMREPRLLKGHLSDVTSLAFSADGTVLASASKDNTVRLWDTTSGTPLVGFEPLVHVGVAAVALDPTGHWLATGGSGGDVHVWDLDSRTSIGQVLAKGTNAATSLAMGSGVLAVGDSAGYLQLWDLTTQQLRWSTKAHNSSVAYVHFIKGDQELVSSDRYSKFCRTNLAELQPTCVSLSNAGGATYLSPDGETFVSVSTEGRTTLWDAKDVVQRPMSLTEPVNPSLEPVFSPDGQILAAACGWASTAKCLWTMGPTPTLLKSDANLKGISSLALEGTLDKGRLATGGWDNLVYLWDLAAPSVQPKPLVGHIASVDKVLFSPDGQILASTASQGTEIRLWNADRPDTSGITLDGHAGGVLSLAFSKDSKTLVSGAADGTLILWDLDQVSWQTRICQSANRNLTREEWKAYIGEFQEFELLCPDAQPTAE